MFATSIGNPDHGDSIRITHKALDAGINLIDTVDFYGDSEEIVGKALKGRRDSVVLATKFSRPMGDDPNRQGTSRRWIMTAVEDSLRRLQTDHIDLYQIHVVGTLDQAYLPPALQISSLRRRPVSERSAA